MIGIIDSDKVNAIKWFSFLGPIGVYAYVVSFAFPVNWDFPMILLVLAGFIAPLFDQPETDRFNRHAISLSLSLFLFSMALSIIFSTNVSKSLRTSVPVLPALLIYFLIVEHFNKEDDIKQLYISFTLTALCISIGAIYHAYLNDFQFDTNNEAHALAGSFSYIIVSRNDLVFLSLMMPFSLISAYKKPLSLGGGLAILTILLSLATIVIFQSRGALLTFFMCSASTFLLLYPKKGKAILISGLFLLSALSIDAMLGFPLLHRYYDIITGSAPITNGRFELWRLAVTQFIQSPWIGNGPHTFIAKIPWQSNGPHVSGFTIVHWPHNLFLEVAFGHGSIGLLMLLIMLSLGLSSAWKLLRSTRTEVRHWAVGAFGSLIGFCFSALFELTFLRLWVTITFFMVLGIIVRLSKTTTQ